MSAITPSVTDPSVAPSSLCANCGAPLHDTYCSVCGEKRLDHHDLTMAHVLGHALHEVTHFDSKIFNTLRLLIVRPGFLTREYFAGRRTRYVGPLRIFITVFAASLFLYSFTRDLNIWDFGKFLEADKAGTMRPLLEKAARRKATTTKAIVEEINHGWHHWTSLLQFMTVGLLATGLSALYLRSKRHFVEHFVFSLHLVSFALLVAIVTWPLWRLTGYHPGALNLPLVLGSLAVDVGYTILAVRSFYPQTPVKTVIKGILVFVMYYATTVAVTLLALLIGVIGAVRK